MGLSHLWFLDYVVIKMSIFGEIIDIWKCIDIIQDSERMVRECWPIGMESQAEARLKLEGAQAEQSQVLEGAQPNSARNTALQWNARQSKSV